MIIAPSALPNPVVNQGYSQTVTASGGTAPYTYSVSAGTLPAGLALDGATGIISGTPTLVGTVSFTIRATDATPTTFDQAYTVYVSAQMFWFICATSPGTPLIPQANLVQSEFNRRTVEALSRLSRANHQVGHFLARPTSAAINGHLLCDGSAVSRASYAQLFNEIGTTWGSGDGSTTFNLPNLVATALPLATVAPTQTVTDSTVSTGGTVSQPSGDGQIGGSTGGNVSSGGSSQSGLDTELP